MKAIYLKEILHNFHSIVGYAFLTVSFLISGILFAINNLIPLKSDITSFFSTFLSISVFLLPLLTMRLFAEEKKMKTDQLIMTAPIKMSDVVIGKYLASLTMFGIILMETIPFFMIIAIFGELQLPQLIGTYIAVTIIASSFLAIGMLISAQTENQIVAAVITYAVLITLWLLGAVRNAVGKPFSIIINYLAVLSRYTEFSLGILNPTSALYYFGFIFFCLFVTIQVMENKY